MRWIGGAIGFLALGILLLPRVGADEKKDSAKADVKITDKKDTPTKDADKKNADKKDAAKDAKKTDAAAKKKPAKKEAAVVYGQTVSGELKRYDSGAAHSFVIAVPEKDKKKVNEVYVWQANELARINSSPVRSAQDAINRARQMSEFQINLARKYAKDIYTNKDVDYRLANDCKVRRLTLPVEFDLKGQPMKRSAKELRALRGSGRLPGYAATLDQLEAGQQVKIYLAKTKHAKGTSKSKNRDDDDEPVVKPPVVMVLITKAAPQK